MSGFRTPWRQGEDEFSIYVEDVGGRIIADVRNPSTVGDPYQTVDEATERHRAVARLLAAAPELLELVKDCRAYLESIEEGIPPGAPSVERFEAVIAKAEGEA